MASPLRRKAQPMEWPMRAYLATRCSVSAAAFVALATASSIAQNLVPFDAASLVPIARTAGPLIAALDAFRAQRGHCPALTDRAEFAAILGKPILPFSNGALNLSPGESAPWIYQVSVRNNQHCSLSKKLSWDPDLVYSIDANGSRWLLLPGDGGPDRPLDLKP